jgi:hypothetical protein
LNLNNNKWKYIINEGDTTFLPIFEVLKDVVFSWVTEIWILIMERVVMNQ